MANRILLNNNALRVSQPGVNVLSATPAQLLFSSDWSAMGIVASGTYSIGTGSWSGSSNTRTHNGTINLPKTFPSPPAVAFYLVTGGVLVPVGFGSGCFFGWVRNGSSGQNRALAHAQVTNSQIEIRAMFDKQYTPGLVVPSFDIRYFVFDYNT